MMQHLSEEDLILHYYGEAEANPSAEGHLVSCRECRIQYQQLQRVLNVVDMPVPERGSEYPDQVWNRLAPKLGVRGRWHWLISRKWVAAAVMASVILAAFVAGRYLPPASSSKPSVAQAPVRERILVVAVGDHLDRSQMVLVELMNSDSRGKVDISGEQEMAESLLGANRLYRQTALAAGDRKLAAVLDDLERVLVEVAHSPENATHMDLEALRERIDSEGLLFKIRVVGSLLNNRADQIGANRPSQQL